MMNGCNRDTQNLHMGIKARGWELDWSRFRVYLREKYAVANAYLFIGYIPHNEELYRELRNAGFRLIYRPTVLVGGKIKGNVDVDLGVHALTTQEAYDRAVIISSDGDFRSLVAYLDRTDKLRAVISPHVSTCSHLLKRSARGKIVYLEDVRHKVEKRSQAA